VKERQLNKNSKTSEKISADLLTMATSDRLNYMDWEREGCEFFLYYNFLYIFDIIMSDFT
jgi:hypothetical protein